MGRGGEGEEERRELGERGKGEGVDVAWPRPLA